MHTLSIDLETYSDVDIKVSGVYPYVETNAFEILLFAYACDNDPVICLDLTKEAIPDNLIQAIFDPAVVKTAFNANFEITCLSKHLGIELDASQWDCTMVRSLMLGLPGSLEMVAKVLKLPAQKDQSGALLIRYFSKPCKPTKVNGERERNLPEHAPERWAEFKSYCIQDVEVERAIRNRLLQHGSVPDQERALWLLDQEINRRGVLVDRSHINHAMTCAAWYTEQLVERAKALTQLDNPNSLPQLKSWLQSRTGIPIASLTKDTIPDYLEAVKQSGCKGIKDVVGMLKIRKEMSKTSVKKYAAMQNAVCRDNRIRGLLAYYGANRTGRWCLTGDHELLTTDGWVRLDKWNGGEIACWHPTGETVSFQKAEKVEFDYEGLVYMYEDKRISQVSTPDHKMYIKKRYGGIWQEDIVENMQKYRPSIPFTGFRRGLSGMEHSRLRVLVMVQADGFYQPDGSIRLHFKKERKIERCKHLLRRAGITFVVREYAKTKVHSINISSRDVPLWLRIFRDKTFGTWLLDESADVFFDELVNWDGYQSAPNSIQYSTCNKKNADTVQAFAHVSGRSALIRTRVRSAEHPNWKDAYYVDIWLAPGNCHEIKKKPEVSGYVGKVYCAVTSTGYFLVRRNGRVWVTGNSGRLVQIQNLPQNKYEDLDLARQLLNEGAYEDIVMLYDSVPNVLSQLIRTAFIPKEGCQFLVADFSAIEARVIAWLANETWRLDVFNSHGKIYEASASQMFKAPIESITKGNPLRQKGKIAELALGYGGGTGALEQMGALKMGIAEDELQGLVDSWRDANPNITALWRTVNAAALKAVGKYETVKLQHGLVLEYRGGILFIRLPSGRKLSYINAKLGTGNTYGNTLVTYQGVNQTSKQWETQKTYGGKLVENIVQAIARDCLAYSMMQVAASGYQIVMHVHDEIIVEHPIDDTSLDKICEIMGQPIPWAEGLPLRADGYATPYYKKD